MKRVVHVGEAPPKLNSVLKTSQYVDLNSVTRINAAERGYKDGR